ncbi:MAG: acetolactate synthase-1/2/3 large subunit [Granulosicoccus sp.]
MKKTIASLVVDSLIANGINTLYCVPGVQNDNLFDAIYDRQDELNPVQARHEQGAVYMALGSALATGRHQAFSLVPGPGLLNGSAALCTAYAVNAPIFGVVGQIPSGAIGKGLGLLHEIEGQLEIISKLTKHADRISNGSTASDQMLTALSELQTGRPRPVAVEVPVDMWLQECEYDGAALQVNQQPFLQLDSADIAKAARLIEGSQRPLIVVGSGAQAHAKQVRELARSIGAGTIAFRNGHGVMPSNDSLHLNMPAGHALWPDCDLVIGLGTRLIAQKKQWGLDDKIKVIHVDIDADQLTKSPQADIAIHADLVLALPALQNALQEQPSRREWREQMVSVKQEIMDKIAGDLAPQLSWLSAIRKALPENGLFVDELTQIGFVSRFAFPIFQPRTFLSTGYQGTLGWGIATAIGAAHARRDVPVVSVTGDGGALFSITELATAVHHKIPVNIVVMNDNAFGNVRGIQRDEFDGRYIASSLTSPDFVALAKSFGVTAARAHTPVELELELVKAIANDGPNLIEVPVGEFPSPWKYIQLGQVRGM